MGHDVVRVALSAKERRIISALRDLPAGQPRELLEELVESLVEFVREPQCAELQADGAPCTSPASDCEQCSKLKEILTDLRRRVPRV